MLTLLLLAGSPGVGKPSAPVGSCGKAAALRNRATVHLKFQSSCKTQHHEEGMNGAVFISAMQMSVSTAMLSLVIRKQRDFIRRPLSLIMENVYTG